MYNTDNQVFHRNIQNNDNSLNDETSSIDDTSSGEYSSTYDSLDDSYDDSSSSEDESSSNGEQTRKFPYPHQHNHSKKTRSRTILREDRFKYGKRTAIISLPCFIIYYTICGNLSLLLTCGILLLVTLQLKLNFIQPAFVVYILGSCFLMILLLYSLLGYVWNNVLQYGLFVAPVMLTYTALTLLWLPLHVQGFQISNDLWCSKIEIALFTIYPSCFILIVTWLSSMVVGVWYTPTLFAFYAFILLLIYMEPKQRSYQGVIPEIYMKRWRLMEAEKNIVKTNSNCELPTTSIEAPAYDNKFQKNIKDNEIPVISAAITVTIAVLYCISPFIAYALFTPEAEFYTSPFGKLAHSMYYISLGIFLSSFLNFATVYDVIVELKDTQDRFIVPIRCVSVIFLVLFRLLCLQIDQEIEGVLLFPLVLLFVWFLLYGTYFWMVVYKPHKIKLRKLVMGIVILVSTILVCVPVQHNISPSLTMSVFQGGFWYTICLASFAYAENLWYFPASFLLASEYFIFGVFFLDSLEVNFAIAYVILTIGAVLVTISLMLHKRLNPKLSTLIIGAHITACVTCCLNTASHIITEKDPRHNVDFLFVISLVYLETSLLVNEVNLSPRNTIIYQLCCILSSIPATSIVLNKLIPNKESKYYGVMPDFNYYFVSGLLSYALTLTRLDARLGSLACIGNFKASSSSSSSSSTLKNSPADDYTARCQRSLNKHVAVVVLVAVACSFVVGITGSVEMWSLVASLSFVYLLAANSSLNLTNRSLVLVPLSLVLAAPIAYFSLVLLFGEYVNIIHISCFCLLFALALNSYLIGRYSVYRLQKVLKKRIFLMIIVVTCQIFFQIYEKISEMFEISLVSFQPSMKYSPMANRSSVSTQEFVVASVFVATFSSISIRVINQHCKFEISTHRNNKNGSSISTILPNYLVLISFCICLFNINSARLFILSTCIPMLLQKDNSIFTGINNKNFYVPSIAILIFSASLYVIFSAVSTFSSTIMVIVSLIHTPMYAMAIVHMWKPIVYGKYLDYYTMYCLPVCLFSLFTDLHIYVSLTYCSLVFLCGLFTIYKNQVQ